MMRYSFAILILACLAHAGNKPMEAITNYNVVLVHGAAPSSSGFVCDGTESPYLDAYSLAKKWETGDTNAWNLGDAANMIGSYGTTKRLTHWLNSVVFEYTADTISSPYIYVQRSFSNPANAPSLNAHEIGDRNWVGENNCSSRRSLFEEAQEIRAGGQDSLKSKRNSEKYRFLPSRYILIAHSMGGVASREYVQSNYYNDDVDKALFLDSPHEGTEALQMLIDAKDPIETALETAPQYFLLSYALSLLDEPTENLLSFLAWSNGLQAAAKFSTILGLGDGYYDYKSTDPLVNYIRPESDSISNLKNKPYVDQLPSMRLMYGTGGLTFTDPNSGALYYTRFIIPDVIMQPLTNVVSQLIKDTPADLTYINAVSGAFLGAAGFSVRENGTALIPSWSGKAKNTVALNDPRLDIRRFEF
ncbi:MAG TPA: hypothetical protein VLM37_06910, partial [Fibrobacteraceae bacterium]|nr:hypothetical protein [Fibrobacteraceae bacterium]